MSFLRADLNFFIAFDELELYFLTGLSKSTFIWILAYDIICSLFSSGSSFIFLVRYWPLVTSFSTDNRSMTGGT